MTFDEWWNNEDNDWARDQNPVRAITLKNLAETAWGAALEAHPHITRLVGDPPVCAYLSDGTKIRVGRTAETKGPAWLEHVPQDRLRPQGKEPK